MLPRQALAEFLGTFGLVFLGTGAVVLDHHLDQAIGVGGIALVFGLAVLLMILAVGRASGAHINPAVTAGFWARGETPWRTVLVYWLAQALGAIAASGVLRALSPQHPDLGATLPAPSPLAALGIEFFLTVVLMGAIVSAAWFKRRWSISPPILIGAVVALEAWSFGPITGASMNPARSLGPGLVSGHIATLWLYVVGPILGAVLVGRLSRPRRPLPQRT